MFEIENDLSSNSLFLFQSEVHRAGALLHLRVEQLHRRRRGLPRSALGVQRPEHLRRSQVNVEVQEVQAILHRKNLNSKLRPPHPALL